MAENKLKLKSQDPKKTQFFNLYLVPKTMFSVLATSFLDKFNFSNCYRKEERRKASYRSSKIFDFETLEKRVQLILCHAL